MLPLVSVVVPVYNTEKYLPECIESIINQTYHNLEIILVNDESTDRSLQVCIEYSLKDSRIRIVESSHQGVLAARISGVETANGEFCMFVDSDDWIAENLVESILPLTLNGVDVVNYSLKSVSEGVESEWSNTILEGIYEKKRLVDVYKKMMFDFTRGCPGIIQSLCTKLIKRDLLWENIVFADCRITLGEDASVTYPIMLQAKKVAVTNKILYHYRVHSGSMTTSRNMSVFTDIYIFQQYLKKVFATYDKSYCLEEQLQAYTVHFIEKGIRDIFSLNFKAVYHIPFYNLPDMCGRIVLYGAGNVGKSYYRQLMKISKIDVVAWIDKKEDQYIYGRKIQGLSTLGKIQFDKILIAVKDRRVAQEIKSQLSQFVLEEQMIWEEPYVDWLEREYDLLLACCREDN